MPSKKYQVNSASAAYGSGNSRYVTQSVTYNSSSINQCDGRHRRCSSTSTCHDDDCHDAENIFACFCGLFIAIFAALADN